MRGRKIIIAVACAAFAAAAAVSSAMLFDRETVRTNAEIVREAGETAVADAASRTAAGSAAAKAAAMSAGRTAKASAAVTTAAETTTTTTTATAATTTASHSLKMEFKGEIVVEHEPEPEPAKALNYDRQRGMWVSLFELERLIKGRSEEDFRYGFEELCRSCKALGINTLYVHARPLGDAFYESGLFPWSRYASGTSGMSPGYDPFAVIPEIAHSFGLSVHAWINPYRCEDSEGMAQMPDSCIIKQWYNYPDSYPEYISYAPDYGKYWLNPGVPEVQRLIADGVRELVTKYDIDGVQIDDYFYPTTETWFDEGTYNSYLDSGGWLSYYDWRLENCTGTVKLIYDTVKEQDTSLWFGIAPQGNYENNYTYMYADVARWLSEPGYCDYFAPQIYFSYGHPTKPFKPVLDQWLSLPRDSSVQLVIGIAPANIELDQEYCDQVGIIAQQISDSTAAGAGIALFRFDSLYYPSQGFDYRMAREIEEITKELNINAQCTMHNAQLFRLNKLSADFLYSASLIVFNAQFSDVLSK